MIQCDTSNVINIRKGFGFETHKLINLWRQESQFFAWSETRKSRKSKKNRNIK